MGKKEKAVGKVVLDTNTLISALLFRGSLAVIVDLWKSGRCKPIFSKETFSEFRTVLEYPKFSLTTREMQIIIQEEVLPYFETVEVFEQITGICRDPDDDKFLACAVSASAAFVVSGDRDLLDLGSYKSIRTISPSDFLKKF